MLSLHLTIVGYPLEDTVFKTAMAIRLGDAIIGIDNRMALSGRF